MSDCEVGECVIPAKLHRDNVIRMPVSGIDGPAAKVAPSLVTLEER